MFKGISDASNKVYKVTISSQMSLGFFLIKYLYRMCSEIKLISPKLKLQLLNTYGTVALMSSIRIFSDQGLGAKIIHAVSRNLTLDADTDIISLFLQLIGLKSLIKRVGWSCLDYNNLLMKKSFAYIYMIKI